MSMKRVTLVTSVCLLLAGPLVYADTVHVTINFTDPPDPNSDFEGSSYWTSFDGITAFLGTRQGQASKGYLKWHSPELEPPAGMTTVINSAIMTWFCNELTAVNPALEATLYKVADNTWTHDTILQYGGGRPEMGDAILTFRPAGTALENPVTHDLTAYLQEVVDAGGTVMSLGADAPADGNDNSYIRMDGPEAAGYWLVPYLDVDYTFDGEPSDLPGDANLDGVVDDADLSLLLANWNTDRTGDPDGGWSKGEFDETAPVQDNDLSLLLTNWTTGGQVPEPASALIMLLGFAGAALRRGRN